MAWGKRILIYLGVNILVVTTITLLLSVFHVNPYLTKFGLDLPQLAIACLLYGFAGSLISLGLSRAMAKWLYGVKLINTATCSERERWVVQTIQGLCRKAGLEQMPEIGIYQSTEANAFATGPCKSRSLVAVSSGILDLMSNDEIEGVLGHEITHITNGDMVTMTLITGLVNAFVMFLSRAIAYSITRGSKDSRGIYLITVIAVQFVLMALASILIATYSRKRECCADEGGADLAGREKMISALEALQRTYQNVDMKAQPALQTMKISTQPQGIWKLFASHPPLDERIAKLRNYDPRRDHH